MTIGEFFKQIKTVLSRWSDQSHTRHLTFAQRIRDRVKSLVIDRLGASCPAQVSQAYTGFSNAVDHEDDTYKVVTKSPRTEEIQQADSERDNTWSGIMNFIDFMKRLGTAVQQAAAKRIQQMAEQYKIKNNERYEDQNTHTMQFIQQCEGALAADIATLNMGEYIAQLKSQTQTVIDLIGLRNAELANVDTRAMTPAREAVENAYVKLVGILNAHAITECEGGSSPYDQVVDVINSDIDYYVSKVFAKSSGSGSSPSPSPDPEPTPDPQPDPDPDPDPQPDPTPDPTPDPDPSGGGDENSSGAGDNNGGGAYGGLDKD